MAEAVVRRRRTGRHQIPRPQRRRHGRQLRHRNRSATRTIPGNRLRIRLLAAMEGVRLLGILPGRRHMSSFSTLTDQTHGVRRPQPAREANVFADLYGNYLDAGERLDAKYPRHVRPVPNRQQQSDVDLLDGRRTLHAPEEPRNRLYAAQAHRPTRSPCRTCASISRA